MSTMYPLPPELSEKIYVILEKGSTDPVHPMQLQYMHDRIAALMVRENRRMRQQVCELWHDYSSVADQNDVSDSAIAAAAGGEFTCEYIVNKILKPNVYFKDKEIDRLIEDFYEEEDDLGI